MYINSKANMNIIEMFNRGLGFVRLETVLGRDSGQNWVKPIRICQNEIIERIIEIYIYMYLY